MGKLQGKVAFITGAARGQGRSHAVRLAKEGADIIAIDICNQIDSVAYPMSSPEDLDRTAGEVHALGRRVVAIQADIREASQLRHALADGVSELGRLDIVVANAGIAGMGCTFKDEDTLFRDVIEVNLVGAWNTISVAAPILIEQGRGGSIVITSSTQGLVGRGGDGSAALAGYCAAKHGVVGLMRSYCNWLGPYNIRVNSVHPTAVNTPMATSDAVSALLATSTSLQQAMSNLMPVPMIEAVDVSNAVAWLVSDEARYITGITLPVDAGCTSK
jgi:SDR family mycofactocin-dependent oxidoreductase